MIDASGIGLIRPDWSVPANVRSFTTTRDGGFSRDRWSTLNLGDQCGDNPAHVNQNRELLQPLLPSGVRWLKQVHGTRVVNRDEVSGGLPEADAVFSFQTGQVCAVLTADCLPVLFCNRAATKVAAAHAGWRGLAGGILEATISAMACAPAELIAWLGPAIGPEAYEVGDEVYDSFMSLDSENASLPRPDPRLPGLDPGSSFLGRGFERSKWIPDQVRYDGSQVRYDGAFKRSGDRWLADLYGLARRVLLRAGIKQVSGGRYCTYSEPDKFFSYRRDGVTGRMASVIWLERSGSE